MLSKLTVIFLWTILVGIILFSLIFHSSGPNEYSQLIGRSINTEAQIVEDPNITSAGNQSVVIRPDGFTQNIKASLFHHGYFKKGDRVWIRGQIKQPENFSEFNYVAYLEMNNVFAELAQAKIIVIEPAEFGTGYFLNSIRMWAIRRVSDNFSKINANLILGMLIGYSQKLPQNITEAYRRAGLTHILVVSGFNLTIIATSFGFTAWVIGRRASDLFSLFLIWSFVILAGSSGGVVRAGIMVSLFLVARLFGRLHLSPLALLCAVVVMSVVNPQRLFYDIGLQLSATATFGVLSAHGLRIRLEKEGWFAEILWPTMGAILYTAPIVGYYFGTFSLVSPLANLVILPEIPILMLLGSLSLIPIVNKLIIPILDLGLNLQVKIIEIMSGWPWSSLDWYPHLLFVLSYYCILLIGQKFLLSWINRDLNKPQSSDRITKIII